MGDRNQFPDRLYDGPDRIVIPKNDAIFRPTRDLIPTALTPRFCRDTRGKPPNRSPGRANQLLRRRVYSVKGDGEMATKTWIESGNTSLASTVRSVALDVRRLVLNGGGHPDEVAAVNRRIDWLRDQMRDLPQGSLHRWLDGLDRELEAL